VSQLATPFPCSPEQSGDRSPSPASLLAHSIAARARRLNSFRCAGCANRLVGTQRLEWWEVALRYMESMRDDGNFVQRVSKTQRTGARAGGYGLPPRRLGWVSQGWRAVRWDRSLGSVPEGPGGERTPRLGRNVEDDLRCPPLAPLLFTRFFIFFPSFFLGDRPSWSCSTRRPGSTR